LIIKLTRVLDCRDKLASDVVFKALAFLAPALIDKRTEFRTKDVGEATARRTGKPCNKMPAALFAASILPSLSTPAARAQRVQIFAAIVERDQDISAMMGNVHSRSGLLPWRRVPGVSLPDMQSDEASIFRSVRHRSEDRRCDAGEIVVARKSARAHAR
jgi:hypothetical protein